MPLLSYSGSSQELQKGDEIDSDTDMFVTFIVKDLHTLPVRPRNKSLKSSKISLATYLIGLKETRYLSSLYERWYDPLGFV